ncbi:MAG: hypothetical protein M1499_08480 [Firmicutes bacterium]|nr:hypothetical protein [Bacillota bacterium]
MLKTLDPTVLIRIQEEDKVADAEHTFGKKNQRLADLGLTSSVMHGWFGDVFGLHYTLITVLLWIVGGTMIIHGQLLLGTLVAVMAYAGKIDGFGGGFGVYLVVRTMQANADRVFSLVDSFPLPEGEGSGPRISPALPTGMALAVEGLQLTDRSPQFGWLQPERTMYAVHAGNEGELLLETLAGLRQPLQGRVDHPAGRVALISAESPLPTATPREILGVAHGSPMTRDDVRNVLNRVGLPSLDPDQSLPETLDEDLRRRVALAQAIVGSPVLVLTDRVNLDGHPLRDFFPASTVVTLWHSQDHEPPSGVDIVVTPQPHSA